MFGHVSSKIEIFAKYNLEQEETNPDLATYIEAPGIIVETKAA